ncbi:MAG: Crp/Fnr family transcriptional regulator [Bacteroidia bacterium]
MSSELKYWYIRNHKLFRNLSISEVNQLCIVTRFKHGKKSETIEFELTEKPRIYFLKKGTLKLVHIDDNGDEIVKDLLHKGDLFGELDFADTETLDYEYVKVLSYDAIICTFYREDLELLMLQKPEFALSYIKFIGFNFKKVKNSYTNIFFKDARSRLLLFLQLLIDREEIKTTNNKLPNYLTQKDIAQLICTTRQTVINLFNDMEKEGLLRYSHKEMVILDFEKIKNLAENVK